MDKDNVFDCHLSLIARDGIYLARGVPRKVSKSTRLVVPPGGRIDFLVRKSKAAGSCRLISSVEPKIQSLLGPSTKIIEGTLIECTNSSEIIESYVEMEDFPTRLPPLPSFMQDLRHFPKAERRTIEWTEFQKIKFGVAKYGINGEPYTESSRFAVRLDRVQEWMIINMLAGDLGPAVESHPFHLHTNHFQIVEFKGEYLPKEDYVIGEWRDTIYVPTPGNITVRWIPRHFTGKSLLHCHILSHEDLGMAWPFDIIDKLD